MNRKRAFDDKVMDKASGIVGQPNVFYLMLAIIVGSLAWERPHDVQGWLMWGCTVMFQGCALIPIQYTGNRTSSKIDDMHEWMRERELAREQRDVSIHSRLDGLHKAHERLHAKVDDLHQQHARG